MKKFIFLLLPFYCFSHPVSYTIDLKASYDKNKKIAKIECISSSRNKCGAHNFKLFDENDKLLKTSRFPFLKKSKNIKNIEKPYKMIFFLKKVPEHQYIVYFK